jgi:hypothetical protein
MILRIVPLANACVLAAGLAAGAHADTVEARCDIYPKGSDKVSAVLACSFAQRQGYVHIRRSDGVDIDLRPVGEGPGRYVDAQGRPAYRQSGLGRRGQIFRLADESVYVYWDKAGLPGAPVAPAAAVASGVLPPGAAPQVPLDWSQRLLGVGFQLHSANEASVNRLRIVPSGLTVDNTPIERQVDGQVVGAELADLNADGSPELYVYVRAAGSGSYGSLAAYSANRRRSLSEIALPALADTPGADKGYMGHDQFAVVENRLVRRFPVYKDGDTNAAPTGGVRQLQYKLVPGEAMWQLVVDRIVEY